MQQVSKVSILSMESGDILHFFFSQKKNIDWIFKNCHMVTVNMLCHLINLV